MDTVRKSVKRLVEGVSGRRVFRFGSNNWLLANKDHLEELWFYQLSELDRLLDRLEVNLVLDVGANKGQFATELRTNTRYRGPIFSFEPVPEVFQQLKARAAADPEWKAFNMALGSRNAESTINVSRCSLFSSFLETSAYCKDHFGDDAVGSVTVPVTVRRLDDLLDELALDLQNTRIFLKMDTQGFDLEVFAGIGDKRVSIVALQSELSLIGIYRDAPRWLDSIDIYEKSGFAIIGMFPVNRDEGRVIEYDCLMESIRHQNLS